MDMRSLGAEFGGEVSRMGGGWCSTFLLRGILMGMCYVC